MRFRIESERLIRRNLVPEDAEAAFAWCGDPEVARYMVYPVYTKAEDVERWIRSLDPDAPDEYEAGIVLKETGELIGSGGLYYDETSGFWDIGYNLRRDMWGHGYAAEAIRALVGYVKGQRPVRGIQGRFAEANGRSRRVMEKLGMSWLEDTVVEKFDGSASYPGKRFRRIFEEREM